MYEMEGADDIDPLFLVPDKPKAEKEDEDHGEPDPES